MSEIKTVDIEKIMHEIRTEAAKHSYEADTAYEKVSVYKETEAEKYYGAMQNDIGNAIGNCNILAERPTGGGIGGFFKKLIRKLCRFFVVPITHDQNVFNANVASALSNVYGVLTVPKSDAPADTEELYLLKLHVNRDMQRQLDELALENKRLAQEIEELKAKVSK